MKIEKLTQFLSNLMNSIFRNLFLWFQLLVILFLLFVLIQFAWNSVLKLKIHLLIIQFSLFKKKTNLIKKFMWKIRFLFSFNFNFSLSQSYHQQRIFRSRFLLLNYRSLFHSWAIHKFQFKKMRFFNQNQFFKQTFFHKLFFFKNDLKEKNKNESQKK